MVAAVSDLTLHGISSAASRDKIGIRHSRTHLPAATSKAASGGAIQVEEEGRKRVIRADDASRTVETAGGHTMGRRPQPRGATGGGQHTADWPAI